MAPALTLTVSTPRRDTHEINSGSNSSQSPIGSTNSLFSFGSPVITSNGWISDSQRGSAGSFHVQSPAESTTVSHRRSTSTGSLSLVSPTQSSTGPEGRRGSVGSLYLVSPVESPGSRHSQSALKSPSAQNDPHCFRPPGPTDSRCPCPALNTLANHGYLPHDGKDIPISAFLTALQHPETYNLSPELSKVLAKGGAFLVEDSVFRLPGIIFNDHATMSLHDLALHGGVEHNASVVHKNAAAGQKYAPIRTDTRLLDGFLENRTTVELADIARRRAELEHVSALGPIHAEIARGEWALVLDVFGKAHGGKIPADALRVWLSENRFPDGWHPGHEQGLGQTVTTSKKIRTAMKEGLPECTPASDAKLGRELGAVPEGV